MSYPKKKQFGSQPHSNRIQQPKYSENQKQALISKLSKALKLKYLSIFLSINYSDNDLYSDIKSLLTKEILSKPISELFESIDKSIMVKVNQRKMANATNDGVQIRTSRNKSITADDNKTQLPSIENINSNTEVIRDNSQNQNFINYTLSNERHDLVDKLRLKMEMTNKEINQNNAYCETAPSDILKQLKEKKLKQKEEIAIYLQKQIEEKEQRELQLKLDNKNYVINQLKQIAQCKPERDEKKEIKIKMQQNFRVSLEKIVKERKDFEKMSRAQKKQTEYNILSNNKLLLDQDKERKKEKERQKQDLYKEMLNERAEYIEAKKQKKKNDKQLDKHYLIEFDAVMRKREKENTDIKESIWKKVKEKEELDKQLLPIYAFRSTTLPNKKYKNKKKNETENELDEFYIRENEEKDKKAEEEKRRLDLKKSIMVKEMKISLEEIIKVKLKEKKEVKELDMKYKEHIVNDYNLFINEQERKKEIKREKIKKYKADLDDQLREKKKNEIDLLKQPVYPLNYHSRITKDDE